MRGELPEFREWSIAAVWLLRGVVYVDEARVWAILNSNVSALETYFARIGLRLVVDPSEGMAYLRQFSEHEAADGYEDLPKLFRSSRLSRPQTIASVILRDELRRFEEEDLRNERCVVEEAVLFDRWKTFVPTGQDEVRSRKDLLSTMKALEDLGFVRRFGEEPLAWEIRRILKARLSISDLERLRDTLAQRREELATAPTDKE